MSLGAVTNVEQAINRGLADADAHTTSIQAAESDMLLSQASISTATADIGALKETVVALVAAAAERASKLAATKGALKSAATLLTKTTADLTTVRQKVEDLEAEVEGSCGSACKAGTYVSTPCTDDEMHVCSACANGTFSLGGFPHACTLLSTCSAGTFVETAGSAGADTVRCVELATTGRPSLQRKTPRYAKRVLQNATKASLWTSNARPLLTLSANLGFPPSGRRSSKRLRLRAHRA